MHREGKDAIVDPNAKGRCQGIAAGLCPCGPPGGAEGEAAVQHKADRNRHGERRDPAGVGADAGRAERRQHAPIHEEHDRRDKAEAQRLAYPCRTWC